MFRTRVVTPVQSFALAFVRMPGVADEGLANLQHPAVLAELPYRLALAASPNIRGEAALKVVGGHQLSASRSRRRAKRASVAAPPSVRESAIAALRWQIIRTRCATILLQACVNMLLQVIRFGPPSYTGAAPKCPLRGEIMDGLIDIALVLVVNIVLTLKTVYPS
jgi:hypothetical protein